MFACKTTTYKKVEKPKPAKKSFRRTVIEDGDEMQLKETIKTKKYNNKYDNKIQFNLFDEVYSKNYNYLTLFIYYGNIRTRGYTH